MRQKALDLGPLPPCPFHRQGRHDLAIVLPPRGKRAATLICSRCGSARRVSLLGPVRAVAPLDDLSAAEIAAAARR